MISSFASDRAEDTEPAPRLLMFSWLKTLVSSPAPTGAPRLLKSFQGQVRPLCPTAAVVAPGHWRLVDRPSGFAPLFQIEEPGVSGCLLTCRVELRAERLVEGLCLELLSRFPASPPLVARTPSRRLRREDDWQFFEVTQHLQPWQQPSLLRLGLASTCAGTLEIRGVTLFTTPVG